MTLAENLSLLPSLAEATGGRVSRDEEDACGTSLVVPLTIAMSRGSPAAVGGGALSVAAALPASNHLRRVTIIFAPLQFERAHALLEDVSKGCLILRSPAAPVSAPPTSQPPSPSSLSSAGEDGSGRDGVATDLEKTAVAADSDEAPSPAIAPTRPRRLSVEGDCVVHFTSEQRFSQDTVDRLDRLGVFGTAASAKKARQALIGNVAVSVCLDDRALSGEAETSMLGDGVVVLVARGSRSIAAAEVLFGAGSGDAGDGFGRAHAD
jgi:hypothetical protein